MDYWDWDKAATEFAKNGHWPTCEKCSDEMHLDDCTRDFKCKKGCNNCL